MLALLGLATGVQAATIFSTGFETTHTPPYSAGTLGGQNGWITSGTVFVEGSLPFSGTNDAAYIGLVTSATAFKTGDFTVAGSNPVIIASNLAQINPDTYTFSFYSDAGLAGGVTINPDGSLTVNSATPFTTAAGLVGFGGAYNQYAFVANFATSNFTFLLNGGSIASGGFVTPSALQAYGAISVGGGGAGSILFQDDTFAATVTPEPSSLAMMGGGLMVLAIGLKRRRSARV